MGEVCFCVSFIVVLYEVFRTCMDSQIPFRLIEIKMTIKTEGKKWRTAVFLSISCSVLLKTTTKQQQQSQHQKVAKTRVSAAILCPAVCINDVIIQVVMCVKSVTYVTSEPLVKSEPRRLRPEELQYQTICVYICIYTHKSFVTPYSVLPAWNTGGGRQPNQACRRQSFLFCTFSGQQLFSSSVWLPFKKTRLRQFSEVKYA